MASAAACSPLLAVQRVLGPFDDKPINQREQCLRGAEVEEAHVVRPLRDKLAEVVVGDQ